MSLWCEIIVEEPSEGVHRPGKPISGVLRYFLNDTTEYMLTNLKLVGEAICEVKNGNGSLVEYDKFFLKNLSIIDKKEKTIKLAAGSYEFNFEFVLPRNAPSSFKGKYGKIKYKIEAEFFKSFAFINTCDNFKKYIRVYGYVQTPGFLDKRIYGIRKVLYKIITSKESKVEIKAVVKSLTKPGKEVHLKLKVNNDTNIKIPFVKVELIRKSKFIIHGCLGSKANVVKKTIKNSTVHTDSVPANDIAKFSVKVPTQKDLYCVQNCGIIKNEFYLLVTMIMPFPHKNASVIIPIVLGESRSDSLKVLKKDDVSTDNKTEPERRSDSVKDNTCEDKSQGEINDLNLDVKKLNLESQKPKDDKSKNIK